MIIVNNIAATLLAITMVAVTMETITPVVVVVVAADRLIGETKNLTLEPDSFIFCIYLYSYSVISLQVMFSLW